MGSDRQQACLVAAGVSYRYPDGTLALQQVGLTISNGDFCGILGGNGSGKTTLLKVLDGLLRDYQGVVTLDGQEIARLSPRQIYGRMGLVFQNPDEQLFGHTVFEDVAFGPRNMGFDEPEVMRRVRSALADVELEPQELREIHTLSYGQKKRVCIAGLLAMGHQILLLDEPTAGLDPRGELLLMELLTRLNRQAGVTVLMATHQVDLVPVYCSTVHLLDKGRLIRSGSPVDVLSDPEFLQAERLRLPYVGALFHALRQELGTDMIRLPLTVSDGLLTLSGLCRKKYDPPLAQTTASAILTPCPDDCQKGVSQ